MGNQTPGHPETLVFSPDWGVQTPGYSQHLCAAQFQHPLFLIFLPASCHLSQLADIPQHFGGTAAACCIPEPLRQPSRCGCFQSAMSTALTQPRRLLSCSGDVLTSIMALGKQRQFLCCSSTQSSSSCLYYASTVSNTRILHHSTSLGPPDACFQDSRPHTSDFAKKLRLDLHKQLVYNDA